MAEAIYENNKNKIVTISSNNNVPNNINPDVDALNIQSVFGTGWISDIIDGRIIVITNAHLILQNDGVELPIIKRTSISCTVTNAIPKGEREGKNIAVSLRIVGMDISSDIAVLCSLKPGEETDTDYFTFNFSNRNGALEWGDSLKVPFGSNVYVISNAYGTGLSMSTGTIADNDLVFRTLDATYPNGTSQIISSVDVSNGSSGSPLFDMNGKVIGIISWRKIDGGNFVGGANQVILEQSYNRIMKLNPIDCNINNIGVNFQGNTGKGYLGISSFFAVTDQTLKYLVQNFPLFANSKNYNSANGIVIVEVYGGDVIIPSSQVYNAKNLKTGERSGLQQFDIILEIDGVKLGVYNKNVSLDDFSYYKAGKKVEIKILRPETDEIMCFSAINDEYPQSLEYVSENSSIELIGGNVSNYTGNPLNGGLKPYPLEISNIGLSTNPLAIPPNSKLVYMTSFTIKNPSGQITEVREVNLSLIPAPFNYGVLVVLGARYFIKYVTFGSYQVPNPASDQVGIDLGNIRVSVCPVLYITSNNLDLIAVPLRNTSGQNDNIPDNKYRPSIDKLVPSTENFTWEVMNPTSALPYTTQPLPVPNSIPPLYLPTATIPNTTPPAPVRLSNMFALRLGNMAGEDFNNNKKNEAKLKSFKLYRNTSNDVVSDGTLNCEGVIVEKGLTYYVRYVTTGVSNDSLNKDSTFSKIYIQAILSNGTIHTKFPGPLVLKDKRFFLQLELLETYIVPVPDSIII